jgi:hypothetical protein
MRLTVEERVFILESYLKTMPYAHCRQSFVEKFRRQAPVKSAIAKIIKKFQETGSLLDKDHNQQKSVLTPGILQVTAEILPIPNAGFSRANSWRLS